VLFILSSFFCNKLVVVLCQRHSFPTRRSSDLDREGGDRNVSLNAEQQKAVLQANESLSAENDYLKQRIWALTETARLIGAQAQRSEEHTSELQSRENLVCRLLLEKKKSSRPEN